MLTRTQILLDPSLLSAARKRAAEMSISLAEYVRRLLAQDLEGPRRSTDPSLVFDLGDSAGSDIARHKDTMLAEAMGADHHRGPSR